jgi:hypothetical protein
MFDDVAGDDLFSCRETVCRFVEACFGSFTIGLFCIAREGDKSGFSPQ